MPEMITCVLADNSAIQFDSRESLISAASRIADQWEKRAKTENNQAAKTSTMMMELWRKAISILIDGFRNIENIDILVKLFTALKDDLWLAAFGGDVERAIAAPDDEGLEHGIVKSVHDNSSNVVQDWRVFMKYFVRISEILNLTNVIDARINMQMRELDMVISDGMKKVEIVRSQSDELTDKINNLQNVVSAQTSRELFQNAIKRWDEGGAAHSSSAMGALRFAAAIPFVTLGCSWGAGYLIFSGMLAIAGGNASELHRAIVAGASSAIILTFGVWATRIAIRYYLTEQHLKNDCDNRAAVIETFIKLQADLSTTDADRAMLIQAVMRPSSDGIVHDDAAPVMPGTLFTGLFQKMP